MKKTILLLILLMVVAFGVEQRYGDVIGSHFYHARNWTVGVPFPADSNSPSLHTILGLIDSLGGGVDATIMKAGYGIQLTWSAETVRLWLDTTTLAGRYLALAGKAADAVKSDSALVSATAHALTGGTIDQQARDTSAAGLSLARAKADTSALRAGLAAKLDTNGTAAGSKLLQGKDTTALFNAKTLQGKDTTALFVHSGTDSSTRRVGDTTISGIWRSKTSVVTGAGSAAFGVSCTTGTALGATVNGGVGNVANADSAFVGGGGRNRATAVAASIVGGRENSVSGTGAGIVCGLSNDNRGSLSFIGGGINNYVPSGGYAEFIGAGVNNASLGCDGVVCGGSGNYVTANGYRGTIGGGINNTVSQAYSTIAGGAANLDSAPYSAIFGDSCRVKATDSFAFVLGAGAGSGLLVSDGKRTITIGVQAHNLTLYGGDSAKFWKTMRTGGMSVGDTCIVRTGAAAAAFAASLRFTTYVDSSQAVDTINLAALNASGARARVLCLRESVFVKNGATGIDTLTVGKWADYEYLGAPCSRWAKFGTNR